MFKEILRLFFEFFPLFLSAENVIPSQKCSSRKSLILVIKDNIATFHFFQHISLIKSES